MAMLQDANIRIDNGSASTAMIRTSALSLDTRRCPSAFLFVSLSVCEGTEREDSRFGFADD